MIAQIIGNVIAVLVMLGYQEHRFKRYKRDFEQHMKGRQDDR